MEYEAIRDLASKPYIIQCNDSVSIAHFHTSIELIYVIAGKVSFSSNGKNYTLFPYQIAFADSYQLHSNSPLPSCTTINLVIQQEFLADYRQKTKTKRIPEMLGDTEFNKSIKTLFDELLVSTAMDDDLLIKGYINVILGKLLKRYGTHQSSFTNRNQKIIDILTYIEQNYDSPLTLETISKHFNYNKYHFSKLFNQYINCSLNTYIGIIRVQKVIDRTRLENRPFIDIVLDCGFNSLSTFYRYQKICREYYNIII